MGDWKLKHFLRSLHDGESIFATCLHYLKVNIGACIHLHAFACVKSAGTLTVRYKQTKSINQNEGSC